MGITRKTRQEKAGCRFANDLALFPRVPGMRAGIDRGVFRKVRPRRKYCLVSPNGSLAIAVFGMMGNEIERRQVQIGIRLARHGKLKLQVIRSKFPFSERGFFSCSTSFPCRAVDDS